MKLCVSVVLIVCMICGQSGFAQSETPKPNVPGAQPLEEGWEEVDSRLVFLTTQLANVETSLDAVDKALKRIGYAQMAKKEDADKFRSGNEFMDRKGGGPVRWQEFYGKTAEKFFYHPTDRNSTYHTTTILTPQDPARDQRTGKGMASRQGLPVHQRPPQLDYIYRANSDRQKQAEREAAELGNKIETVLARRRQLESEQSALWAKIAFRVVSGRELATKPLYRFDLIDEGIDAQRLEALRAACDFIRTENKLVNEAQEAIDANQTFLYARMHETTKAARSALDARIIRQLSIAPDWGDPKTSLGKIAAAAKRLEDVSKNINDAYTLAGEGDRNQDDLRKDTFRGLLQEMLVNFAETLLAAHDLVNGLAHEWKVEADPNDPIAQGVSPVIAAPSAPSAMEGRATAASPTSQPASAPATANETKDGNYTFRYLEIAIAEDGTCELTVSSRAADAALPFAPPTTSGLTISGLPNAYVENILKTDSLRVIYDFRTFADVRDLQAGDKKRDLEINREAGQLLLQPGLSAEQGGISHLFNLNRQFRLPLRLKLYLDHHDRGQFKIVLCPNGTMNHVILGVGGKNMEMGFVDVVSAEGEKFLGYRLQKEGRRHNVIHFPRESNSGSCYFSMVRLGNPHREPRQPPTFVSRIEVEGVLQARIGVELDQKANQVSVKAVNPGPAARAGIQLSDIIAAINGVPVTTPDGCMDAIGRLPINQPATFSLIRNGKASDLRVIPE